MNDLDRSKIIQSIQDLPEESPALCLAHALADGLPQRLFLDKLHLNIERLLLDWL
jgi:hypothetical protein